MFTYCYSEQNQGNNNEKNAEEKSNISANRTVGIQRETHDINSQIDEHMNENEMSLLNSQNAINN